VSGLPVPGFVQAVAQSAWIAWVIRAALALPFAASVVAKLGNWPGAVAESAALGFGHPVLVAAATVATQLVGCVLLFTRRLCWLGAGMLAVFTACATLLAHAFWALQGSARIAQMNTFFEHVAIIGGFAAVAVLVHRAWAD
jgi:transmembrane protein